MRKLLEKWLGRKWFGLGAMFGPPAPIIDHSLFGKIILRQGAKGPYWIHETYTDDDICVSLDTTGSKPPSSRQEAFYKAVLDDVDKAFAKMTGLVVPEYEKMLSRPFPSDWREAFKLASVGVPLDGDETREWELTFECTTDNVGWLFTCYFEGGRAVRVGVDT